MTAHRWLWLPVSAAFAVCAFGAVTVWPAFVRSWLVAVLTWGALPVGAVAVLMTHGLTDGAWGRRSRDVWRALAAVMPLFAVALLPLLFGLDELFPWMQPAGELPDVVRRKLAYLNAPFFIARTLVYLGVWVSLAWLLCAQHAPRRAVHAAGLVAWTLTLTFWGVDWLMSLEPEFYSDVFGLMLVTGAGTSALAAGLLLSAASAAPSIRLDLANLWLAVLLGWAFTTFAQLIVIWSGNLPDEIGWYTRRSSTPWSELGLVALALYFVLPFVILLSTAAKRHPKWLAVATGSCLAGHVVYVHWLVLPAFEPQMRAQLWLEPAALLVLGAGVAYTVRGRLRTQRSAAGG